MTTETKTQDTNSAMLPAAQDEGGALVAMDFSAPFGGETISEEEAEKALVEDAGKGLASIPDGGGFEPMIKLLQSMSDEVKAGTSQVQGAKAGDFIFKETSRLYGSQIVLVPCHYREAFVEWKPKTMGSGYVGEVALAPEEYIHLPFGPSGNKTFRMSAKGHEIHPTCYYAVLASGVEGGPVEQGVVAMSKSQVRSARKWNRLIKSQRIVVNGKEFAAPIWGYAYLMGSKVARNNMGDSWHVWEVQKQARTPAALISRARAYAKQIEAGFAEIGSDERSEDDSAKALPAGKKADASKGLNVLADAANNAEEAK